MKTFNVGDKIWVIDPTIFDPRIKLGDEGIVESIRKNPLEENKTIEVVFPSHDLLHQTCFEDDISPIYSSKSPIVSQFVSILKTLAGRTGSMYTEYNAEKKVFYLNFQDDMGEIKVILHNLSEEKFTKILELFME